MKKSDWQIGGFRCTVKWFRYYWQFQKVVWVNTTLGSCEISHQLIVAITFLAYSFVYSMPNVHLLLLFLFSCKGSFSILISLNLFNHLTLWPISVKCLGSVLDEYVLLNLFSRMSLVSSMKQLKWLLAWISEFKTFYCDFVLVVMSTDWLIRSSIATISDISVVEVIWKGHIFAIFMSKCDPIIFCQKKKIL